MYFSLVSDQDHWVRFLLYFFFVSFSVAFFPPFFLLRGARLFINGGGGAAAAAASAVARGAIPEPGGGVGPRGEHHAAAFQPLSEISGAGKLKPAGDSQSGKLPCHRLPSQTLPAGAGAAVLRSAKAFSIFL